ncbi:MAG: SMP-30/gluconolactonase/LRE family protein [Candidatus Solibacter sp.]
MSGWRMVVAAGLAVAALSAQARYSVTDESAAGAGTPAVVVLRDNVAGAEAAVTPSQGGELSSFKVKLKGEWVEFLFRARDYSPAAFPGKGPLLWPALGGQYLPGTTPDNSCAPGPYQVAGKTYTIPCHGFAKSVPWKEVRRSADGSGARVTVQLRESPETLAMYPFAFTVDATYELAGGHLTIDYTVAPGKSNATEMFFSIGNHIAFNVPFVKGSKAEDVTLETASTVQLLRNAKGLLNGEQKERSFQTPEKLGAFDARTALPMAGYRSQPYARLVDPQGIWLRLTQTTATSLPEPLVRFNLYGGPQSGYFCPEPFFGIQNSFNSGKGLVKVKAGESWRWRLELEVGTALPPVASSFAGVTRVAGDFAFVEGPVWLRDGSLVFSDIYNSRITKLGTDGRTTLYRNFTNAANGNSMDAEGRLYSSERDGRRVSRMEKDGSITVVADKWNGKQLNSPNDVVVRRDGHVYFTDPASKAVFTPQELGFNGVYHVTPQGAISLITDKRPRPNGLALTPDGKTLYVADTQERKIYAYDLDAAGNTSHERVLIADTDGGPDGLRVAANGNLYIACRGVAVYTPAGKFVRMIEFPETPANVVFGGADLQTLYVTARTSVYSVRVPDKGPPLY